MAKPLWLQVEHRPQNRERSLDTGVRLAGEPWWPAQWGAAIGVSRG